MKKEMYWSRFADDWETQVSRVVGKRDITRFKNALASCKSLGRVLELGCGNGIYSRTLASEANYLVATDFSDEMVAAARKRLEGRRNIKVDKADCHGLPYRTDDFDTVFMGNLLHIIPAPQKALAEAHRILKPDGRLIVLSCTTEGMTPLNKFLMVSRYLRIFGKPSLDARCLTIKNTEEMLRDSSFRVENIKLVGKRTKAIFVCAKLV